MLARASETIGVELHRSGESGNELESIGWVRETHQSRKNLTILVPLPCAILRVGRLPVDHFATQNEGVPGGFDADAHDASACRSAGRRARAHAGQSARRSSGRM